MVKKKKKGSTKVKAKNESLKSQSINKVNEEKYKEHEHHSKSSRNKTKFNFAEFYKKSYKWFLLFPFLLFLISTYTVIHTMSVAGTPIYRGISLKGGLSATIYVNTKITDSQLTNYLESKFPKHEFSVSELIEEGVRKGFIVDTDLDEKDLKSTLQDYLKIKLTKDNYYSNYISPSLSNAFFVQLSKILVVSFILMSLVIFLYFREFMPSFIVILSGFFDVYVTVGYLDLIGYKLSIAGMGALLMLIGYSIDTDILLTNRLIKEEGKEYFSKIYDAFKTGITMSLTTLIAAFTAYIFSTSSVIKEITFIIVIGICVDIISTWIQNTGLLLWKLEKD